MELFWKSLISSLGNAESWIKLLLVLVTAPIWWPIARSLWQELQEALAPEGGVFGTRPRRPVAPRPTGQDPFESLVWATGRPGAAPLAVERDTDALEHVRRRGF